MAADEEGRWVFNDVPGGAYTISLSSYQFQLSETDPGRHWVERSQEVTVTGADVSDVVVAVPEGGTLAGTGEVEGQRPLPLGVAIELEPADDGPETVREMRGGRSRGIQDGKFLLQGLPAGSVYVTARLMSQDGSKYYVKAITLNGKDVMRQPLKIRPGGDLTGVRVVLSPDVGRLTGRITSAQTNEPAAREGIVLVPLDPATWGRQKLWLMNVTNSEGHYRLSGAPGEYFLFPLRALAHPATAAAYIAEQAAEAPRITLLAGETVKLDLTAPLSKAGTR